ncbi:MAG: DUF3857 domain-containing protein [Candidatus Eisenbacteria bacterium]|nr:DUF3857 domain-containing protein [Candidatus Eisenbacteria bacterium]
MALSRLCLRMGRGAQRGRLPLVHAAHRGRGDDPDTVRLRPGPGSRAGGGGRDVRILRRKRRGRRREAVGHRALRGQTETDPAGRLRGLQDGGRRGDRVQRVRVPHREGRRKVRYLFRTSLALLVALLLAAPAVSRAEPAGAMGRYDIGELFARAEAAWDLGELDAVVLLDSEDVQVGSDGGRKTTVHRIVWMATDLALEAYADLRVPWNSETSRLEVLALRTWRDDTWWPDETEISQTAVVPTIPSAVQRAADYAEMRETMLLHDGVELPCIVETVYEMTELPAEPSRDRTPAAGGPDGAPAGDGTADEVPSGASGMWAFQKSDPCVVSRLQVTAPADVEVRFEALNGSPENPASHRSSDHGVTYTWEMSELDRLPRPLTAYPEGAAPGVVWSTWRDWETLGRAVLGAFDRAARLTPALRDSVAALVEDEPASWAGAEAIAAFVSETTRPVRYPHRFWRLAPRTASRTWETAYGHTLDRAVLASALFGEAGLKTHPLFLGRAANLSVAAGSPSLSPFDGPYLRLEASGLDAVYDPATSSLTHTEAATEALAVWALDGTSWTPLDPRPPETAEFELVLEVEGGDEGWTGTGYLRATGAMSPYAEMLGLEKEASSHLASVAGTALPGAHVTDWSALEFGPERVVCGFAFDYDPGEEDEYGRHVLELGEPEGAVLSQLPRDVHLYSAERESPVVTRSALLQSIELRVRPQDQEVVYHPPATSISNAAGSLEVAAEAGEEGELTLRRRLELIGSRFEPGEWTALRELLLEETHERNGRVLLK